MNAGHRCEAKYRYQRCSIHSDIRGKTSSDSKPHGRVIHVTMEAASSAAFELMKRFGVPSGMLPFTAGVAVEVISDATSATERQGATARTDATTPATCGAAMLVPDHAL